MAANKRAESLRTANNQNIKIRNLNTKVLFKFKKSVIEIPDTKTKIRQNNPLLYESEVK